MDRPSRSQPDTLYFQLERNWSMARSISLRQIEQTIVHRAKIAADRYEKASGGHWLSGAPESYLQSQIFDGLADMEPLYATLESSPTKIRTDFEIKRDLRSDKMRQSQRFDILLWYANGQPRAIIEVKKIHRRNFSGAIADVKRMRPWINNNQPNLQRGYLLAYLEATGISADQKIIERAEEFAARASSNRVSLEVIRDSIDNFSCAIALFAVEPQR